MMLHALFRDWLFYLLERLQSLVVVGSSKSCLCNKMLVVDHRLNESTFLRVEMYMFK